jgi:hypothetical protein
MSAHKRRIKRTLAQLPRAWHIDWTKVLADVAMPKRPRKAATYYCDWCCRECFFDWAVGFHKQYQYKHTCCGSNYDGLLKKYWRESGYEIEEQ